MFFFKKNQWFIGINTDLAVNCQSLYIKYIILTIVYKIPGQATRLLPALADKINQLSKVFYVTCT